MTDFSSHGSITNSLIKPDLVAPGESIISLCSEEGFRVSSGTSMATPMVAGAAALLREAHPDWSVDEVTSALCTHAKPLRNAGDNKPYSPIVQGSGRLNVAAAISGETFIHPHNVRLVIDSNDPECHEIQKELTLKNRSGHEKAYVFGRDKYDGNGLTIEYPSSITLGAGEITKVKLKVRVNQKSIGTLKDIVTRIYVKCGNEKLNIPFLITIN